jgi:hypothetical protein
MRDRSGAPAAFRPKATVSVIQDDPGVEEQPVTYDGLEAVALNEPVIELTTDDGQVLDLHNGGHVVAIEIEMPADLVVRLTYIEPARWTARAKPEREIDLRFGDVRSLTVAQHNDSQDAASSTFEDLTAWPSPSPRFMLRTGNHELRFDAHSVRLKHHPID